MFRVLSALAATGCGTADWTRQATERPGVVEVFATGEVEVAPDEAIVDFSVETTAATAEAAGAANARRTDQLLRALVEAGVPRDAISTAGFGVFPEYSPPPPVPAEAQRPPRIVGYRAHNAVVVEIAALDRVGPIIDRALSSGADRVGSVRFGLSRPEAAQADALRRAVENARNSAQAIAASLGMRLGAVVRAKSTPEQPVFPVRGMAEAVRAPEVTTPILPGPQTVTATVTVVYALEPER